jgi:hypothetical protein
MKKLVPLLLFLTACGGSASGDGPSVPIYPFYCRHEAILAAIAIEPYCASEPVIHWGETDEAPHAEAYCEELGYVRIIGTRALGVYPAPGRAMKITHVYRVSEYLAYVFRWTIPEACQE